VTIGSTTPTTPIRWVLQVFAPWMATRMIPCLPGFTVTVTFGVGGAPGTAQYEGRAVQLSTQALSRDQVGGLEGCLAQQAGACVEQLLGPDETRCVSSGAGSCEAARADQVSRSNGEISFALKRGCVPSF